MKKLLFLAAFFCATISIQAQNVTESIISFGKGQLSGYLIDIPNTDVKLAEAAFRDLLEQKYNLKASKESGFRAYLNQPFSPIGQDNYDLYFTVSEYGKKKNKTTQISFIACSGNLNAITSQNNPETADNIKMFLKRFVKYVNEYSINKQADEISAKINKLNDEKASLEKNQEKLNKQIEKLNKDIESNKGKLSEKEKQIKDLTNELNKVKSGN